MVHDVLYLLFPKSEGNNSFIIAHYAQATSLDAVNSNPGMSLSDRFRIADCIDDS